MSQAMIVRKWVTLVLAVLSALFIVSATPAFAQFEISGDVCFGTGTAADGSCNPVESVSPDDDSARYLPFGGLARSLYDLSMSNTKSFCVMCSFGQYFTSAMADVSYATFRYFVAGFEMIAPVAMGIWISLALYKMLLLGGEGGPQVIVKIVGRFAYFAFVWMIVASPIVEHQGPSNNPTRVHRLWSGVGPTIMSYGFDLSEEIKAAALLVAPTASGNQINSLLCKQEALHAAGYDNADRSTAMDEDALMAVALTICGVERMHIMGIATGLAVMGSEPGNTTSSIFDSLVWVFQIALNVVTGGAMAIIFILSAIWFFFLVLDIVVRAMITAAFVPVFLGIAIFDQLRGYSMKAISGMASAVVSAIAIGVTGAVMVFVVSNVVNVYDAMSASVGPGFLPQGTSLYVVPQNGDRFRSFLAGVLRNPYADNVNHDFIPMNFGTPWYLYMLLSAIAIKALGKKLVSIIESVLGQQGASAMADDATGTMFNAGRMATTAALAAPGIAAAAAVASGGVGGRMLQKAFPEAASAVGNIVSKVNPFGSADKGASITDLTK